jgi:hypothetical protein
MKLVRLYLNTSALNLPFDDLTAQRVRLEAEAVAALLSAVEEGKARLLGSDYLDFEVGQDPDPERVHRVRALLRPAAEHVGAAGDVVSRARELESLGLRGLDALHIASAEAGRADLLITTDDRMIRASRKAKGSLRVEVVGPAEALARMGEAP